MTAEPYEPRPVDDAIVDGNPVVSELLPLPGEAPLGDPVTSTTSSDTHATDGFAPPPTLAPPATNEDGLGGSSSGSEAAEVELDEADAEGELGVPVEPGTDGGVPTAAVEPCTTLAFAGSCYEVFAELVAWDVAEQRCLDWGGHLTSVESAEEDAFLGAWPSALGIFGLDGSGVWLGGTDTRGEGDFRWAADDSPLGFENWGANQPDNGAGIDCIEKRNDGGASWYDRRCTDTQRYVCERPR